MAKRSNGTEPTEPTGEDELGFVGSWEFVDRVPTREEVKALLETLPTRWGVAAVDYLEYVAALPQNKKHKVKVGNKLVDQTIPVYVLYMSVAGRQAMLQEAQEKHGWRVDFEPEPVTPTGVPGWCQNDDRRLVYREACVIMAPSDSVVDGWVPLGSKSGTAWVPQTGGAGSKGSNPVEKCETAARGRALAAWSFGVLPGSGVACVPIRAEALTRDGWSPPDKLTPGELIMAYDIATDTCRWVPLQKVHRPGIADVVTMRNRGWSFTCTPNHRWAVNRTGWPGQPEPGRVMRATDDLWRGQPKMVIARPWEPHDPLPITDREAAILGWLLTDGYIEWAVRGGSVGVTASITQAKYVDDLRLLLGTDASERVHKPAGPQVIRGRAYQCRKSVSFRLHNRFAYDLLRRADLHDKNDAVGVVLRLSPSARRSMYHAMLLANGSRQDGRWRIFCSGWPSVADAFCLVAASLGVMTSRHAGDPERDCVRIGVRHIEPVMNPAAVTPAPPEEVWCPQTELGTWLCRLDGVVTITGNSLEEVQQAAANMIAQQQRHSEGQREESSNRPDKDELLRTVLALLEEVRVLRGENEYDADARTIEYCRRRFGVDVAQPSEDPELPPAVDLTRLNPGHLQIMIQAIQQSIRDLRAAGQEV